jgi:hypothetical protein
VTLLAVHALAPTKQKPPFLVAQLVVMAIFVVIGIFAKNFGIEPLSAQAWKSSKAS